MHSAAFCYPRFSGPTALSSTEQHRGAPRSTSRPALHPGRASPALPAPRTQRARRLGTTRHGRLSVPGSPRRGGCGNKATRAPRHRAWLFAGHPAAARPSGPRPTGAAPPGEKRGHRGAPLPAVPRRGLPAAAPPQRRAPRGPVPEPRPTCCAFGGLTGGGRAAARSCRGAERGRARRAGPGREGPGGAGRPPATALRPPAAAAGPRLSPDAGGGAGGAGREVSADGGAPGAPPRGPSRGPLPVTAAEASGTAASPPGAAAGGGRPFPEARCGEPTAERGLRRGWHRLNRRKEPRRATIGNTSFQPSDSERADRKALLKGEACSKGLLSSVSKKDLHLRRN